jgi:hypothetical protein
MTPLKLIACDPLVGLPRKPHAWLRPDLASQLDRVLLAPIPIVAKRKIPGLNARKALGLEAPA